MNPRTLLVTGCSRGIGLAVTRRLLDEGHAVIGVSRQRPDIDNAGFIHVRLDLSDLQRLPEQRAEIAKSHPQIDGLVLNAGMGRFGALEQFSAAQVRQLIDLNLTSQVLLAREFLPRLKKSGGGDLVFIQGHSSPGIYARSFLEGRISELPLARREVLLLACVESLPLKEVASVLGLPLGTVKTHLRRARLTLAEALARRNQPEVES